MAAEESEVELADSIADARHASWPVLGKSSVARLANESFPIG